ncbi:MAG: hypothetical protein N2235_02565, partial [Fischerella sp.]|nr:hypothetical protein [Fischerella sp.]
MYSRRFLDTMQINIQYNAGQLRNILQDLRTQHTNGCVYIHAIVNSYQKLRSRTVVLRNGEIVYGGSKVPNNQEF